MRALTSAIVAAAVASLLAVTVVVGGTTALQQNSRPSPSGTQDPRSPLFGNVEYGNR
ncbi:MAG: hypothetical protein JWN03_8324 [Nocardia sp.]|uniref:DUF2613 domain-containing protein n=1 Tax=Nocardia sp. TaxID=1821 RepID=UPI0026197158|nr:DUF2613 domain-containing protein [Nocardia sp.]MCU1648049.1 hypothetical protein [Nocardia sp.]